MEILKAVTFFIALYCSVHFLTKVWYKGTRKDLEISVLETNIWGHISVLFWTLLYFLSLKK